MKKRRIFKAVSLILCFLLISVSFAGCYKDNKFYKGAKKHLKDKYDVKCDSLIYYEGAKVSAAEFGIIQLDNGEKVIVSLTDGNYADSYELIDLYEAWMDELTLELGVDVEKVIVYSDGKIKLSNGEEMCRTLGTFWETSEKVYNASNVDEFMEDYYDFTYNEEIDIYVAKPNPKVDWMEELADNAEAYRRKTGAERIVVNVYDSYSPASLMLYPDDYIYHHIGGDGREYAVGCDQVGHPYLNFFHFGYDNISIRVTSDNGKEEFYEDYEE